jgi:hypothetical protein
LRSKKVDKIDKPVPKSSGLLLSCPDDFVCFVLRDFADVVDYLLWDIITDWMRSHLISHAKLNPSIADSENEVVVSHDFIVSLFLTWSR